MKRLLGWTGARPSAAAASPSQTPSAKRDSSSEGKLRLPKMAPTRPRPPSGTRASASAWRAVCRPSWVSGSKAAAMPGGRPKASGSSRPERGPK